MLDVSEDNGMEKMTSGGIGETMIVI